MSFTRQPPSFNTVYRKDFSCIDTLFLVQVVTINLPLFLFIFLYPNASYSSYNQSFYVFTLFNPFFLVF